MDRKKAIEYAKFRLECHTKGDGEYTDYGEFLVAAIEALYKLQRYRDLEEQGRMIVLPKGMTIRKLLEILDGNISSCPIDYNLTNRCELSCFECWLAALEGVNKNE